MANTTFVDGTTPILASWLNDVNKAVYSGTFPSLTTFTLGSLSYSDTSLGFVYGISTNGYAQDIIQNTSSGTAASADYIVSNNLGTSSTYYGDFGMNSSTFSGTGSLSLPNATYLYSANGDLVLGTQTSNAIHFVVNNGATDAGILYPTGAWNLAAPTSLATTLYLTQYAGSYGYGFQLWGSDGTNGTNARIGNSSVTGAASLSFSAANGANYGYLNAYSGGMSLIAQDATSVLNLGTNNATRLQITPLGNVLINTSTDGATSKLQVNGSISLSNSDTNFSGGGNRAFWDYATTNTRIGSTGGGVAAGSGIGLQLFVTPVGGTGNALAMSFSPTGAATLATATSTGYGTPTGGAKQASFAAGSITLPNLAAAVAQLILDLKTFGVLGT